MGTAAWIDRLESVRTRPLGRGPLILVALFIWLAGALYCSGYERLMSGLDNWPESLVWSAVAILPWLALFEWSKGKAGRRLARSPGGLVLLLVATGAGSLALELAVNAIVGSASDPIALLILRRLPAIGVCFLLLLWSRTARSGEQAAAVADSSLTELASSIDWVAAADNYVELHIGGRVVMRRMTMREAERALERHGFLRIHRRYLVSRDRIRSVHFNGRHSVVLGCGEELPVGRSYESNLIAFA